MTPNPELVTIRLPKSHWQQIVDDIENMCGTTAANIEILQHVHTEPEAAEHHSHPCEHNQGINGYHCERWMEENA